MRIAKLEASEFSAYDDLLMSIQESMLFQSTAYKAFLGAFLGPDCTPHYIGAWADEKLVGALPAFSRSHSTTGTVLNSLPFFGSNGGLLIRPGESRAEVGIGLLHAFVELSHSLNAKASTIVTSPFEKDLELYRTVLNPTAEDTRTGQITPLPTLAPSSSDDSIRAALFALYHSKTRNVIRKAESSDIKISHDGNLDTFKSLYAIHEENMTAIGGVVKPWSFFQSVYDSFTYDRDYRIYTATREGVVIAALLVFYFNRCAEYFTPVTKAEARIYQPQSLLCLVGMIEAVKRSCTHWNWGGTGASQTGVYEFKRKWGTQDFPYHYFTFEPEGHPIRKLSPAEILEAFPYFFAVPFSLLNA